MLGDVVLEVGYLLVRLEGQGQVGQSRVADSDCDAGLVGTTVG